MMVTPKRTLYACTALAALFLMLHAVCCPAQPRGMPAQEGITNFGKVSERLFRGARPDAGALKHLQGLGIKTVIDLRMPDKQSQAESTAAQAAGLVYTNIPLRGLGRPKHQQVRTALALIESSPGPVYVHCEHGCDRTGTIIACYRLQHDGWTTDAALQEAAQYGMSPWERGMKRFILDFAKASPTAPISP